MYVHCCGIIIFYKDLTIVVKTQGNRYSFPKGKREKKEDLIKCAYRELNEETGLLSSDIKLLDGYFDELNIKHTCVSVRYYIGILNEQKNLSFIDPEELDEVMYKNIEDVLKMHDSNLKPRRKEILQEAYELYKKYLDENKNI